MNRRTFMKAALGTAAAASIAATAGPIRLTNAASAKAGRSGKQSKPNILWLVAEDLSCEIGCYGEQIVRTPNIDRLAGEGVRFTNAFTTCSVCSPSRSAFMTGCYQTKIGAHQHRTENRKPLPEGVRVFTEYLRSEGYFVCNGNYSFDKNGRLKHRRGKTDFNFTCDNPFDGIDFSQRKASQPFFAMVQFSETHRWFARDRENPIDPAKVSLPACYPDHPLIRRDWADYLECVQVLDKKIGMILERLEKENLADNTLVIFFGDHGRAHIRDKQFLYDGGIKVPLIARWPGRLAAGKVEERMVSAIDFAPATLAAAGIDKPAIMDGQDFLSEKFDGRDHIFAARDRCDETGDRIRCVRSKDFKYIRNYYPDRPYMQPNAYKEMMYPAWHVIKMLDKQGKLTDGQKTFTAPTRPAEELYDLRTDPHEQNNLAKDSQYAEILRQMRARLDEWIAKTGDKGAIKEPDEVIEKLARNRQKIIGSYYKKNGLSEKSTPADFVRLWEKRFANRTGKK